MSSATDDRAVQALITEGWCREWDAPIIAHAVALVLRAVCDDLLAARASGDINDVTDVAHYLDSRVAALTGHATSAGDTKT